ncbi:MBL fold metallo-hydrolase [Archangium primigenium]|uniref:MBL fold metallo-hydrolase n=1 Tax=[Archangium] primigenium TaxID=2792470 RepID=UPI001958A2E5|nr:MBL fold metallo-hydrolase [Archangium primigenium]MBM7112931.1 MBL fold metallo-hydrolase [Archangium primigenium]
MAKGSVFGGKAQGLRLERMAASRLFREGFFHNTTGVGSGLKPGTTFSTLGEFFRGGTARTPPGLLPTDSPLAAWTRPAETGLRATWLGHSTVLLEVDGLRVLTDPVWGERASPSAFMGPRRFQPMPVTLAELPPLDAVIVSHDHYDHLDHPTILELARTPVPFFTSLGVGAHLEAWGVPPERITELDWWESAEIGGGRITAAPSQHFSGRGLERNRTLWSSFVVEGPRHKVFFSGDTGLTEEYAEIRQRLGPFDLVMLEVGAWHPSWGDIHLGPENALQALELLGGGLLLPVHWGTFNLALHAWDEPAETLVRLGAERGTRLVMPRAGTAVEPSRVEGVDPWWRTVTRR